MESSGQWAEMLAAKFSTMSLYLLEYTVLLDDGTLNRSKVTSAADQGVLLCPGMRQPLFGQQLADRRRAQRMATASAGLQRGDPLNPPPRRSSRGGGAATREGRGFTINRRRAPPASGRGRGQSQSAAGSSRAGSGSGALPEEHGIVDDAAGPEQGDDVAEDALDDIDEFRLEQELEGLVDDDIADLFASFEPQVQVNVVSDCVERNAADVEPESAAPGLAAVVSQDLEHTGLEAEGHIDDATQAMAGNAGGASSSSTAVAPAPPPPDAPPEQLSIRDRLGVSGPTPLGYCQQGGRQVLRILRGNPKGSLSVRCYRHVGCSFLLSLSAAPSDEDLIAWCFEVPQAPAGAPSAESKELARRHVALAEKWRPAKLAKSKAKAKAKA